MQNTNNLLYMIAKLYYIDKVKQNEIAKRFNLTSMMVSRYLKEAENENIVTFHVKSPWDVEMEKSQQLCKKYKLKECTVIKVPPQASICTAMANYLSDYVSLRIKDEMTIGISWGHTIARFANLFPYINLKDCNIIQLSGMFISTDYSITPQNIMSEFSKKINAKMYMLNAPLYVKSRAIRDEIIGDPTNQQLLKFADSCSMTILGVSGMGQNASTIRRGIISKEDVMELKSVGAIGDVAGIYIDQNGEECEWSKKGCYTGVPLEMISKANDVICVGGEIEKAQVLDVAARKGYFNTLITSEDVADRLLVNY